MTDKQPSPPPTSSREERLKAALRDNLRRRKAQARERAEPSQPERDESDHSVAALARSQGKAREVSMAENGIADDGMRTQLEKAKREEIAALIALDLGFGDLSVIHPDERRIVDAATASTIESSSAIVPDLTDPIIANVRLSQLLTEYRNLEQLRIDERETLLSGEGGGREDDA